nr:hypothetical protein GCM10020185_82790 [Pseudomonas brassicacearum subsp. brassicacearum]
MTTPLALAGAVRGGGRVVVGNVFIHHQVRVGTAETKTGDANPACRWMILQGMYLLGGESQAGLVDLGAGAVTGLRGMPLWRSIIKALASEAPPAAARGWPMTDLIEPMVIFLPSGRWGGKEAVQRGQLRCVPPSGVPVPWVSM